MGWGGPPGWGSLLSFPRPQGSGPAGSGPVCGVLRAPCVCPVRPPGPLLPRCSRLWPGAKAGVCFLANLNPHCSPLARVVVGACLGGAWYLSADPGEQRGEGGSSPSRCGDAHCVCVPVPEAPRERRRAQLWAVLPLSAGSLGSSCRRCPITWCVGKEGRGKVPSFFLSRCPGEVEDQHLVSAHCSPSPGSRNRMSFHHRWSLLSPPEYPLAQSQWWFRAGPTFPG